MKLHAENTKLQYWKSNYFSDFIPELEITTEQVSEAGKKQISRKNYRLTSEEQYLLFHIWKTSQLISR